MASKRGNGEGSITRHKASGKYMARYTVPTPTGSKRKAIYGDTRDEVREKMTKAMADRDSGVVYDDENQTLGEYLDSWLKGSVHGSVRRSTYDRYEVAVRVHIKPAFGAVKLKKLNPAQVATFYQEKLAAGCAPASVNKLHVTLHKALDQAVRWHMVPRNVCEAVSAPRPDHKEMQPLSPGQVRALLFAASGDRLEALYVLAVHTGMREGELLALRWADVDLEAATASVRRTLTTSGTALLTGDTKTGKSRRTISLTKESVDALRRHRKRQLEERMRKAGLWEDRDLVFASEGGTLINPTNLRKRSFAKLLQRAELPKITFHDLRHTCATLLFGRNVHPKYVQELLGHASIAITLDIYSHVMPGMGDQTARAMEDALS